MHSRESRPPRISAPTVSLAVNSTSPTMYLSRVSTLPKEKHFVLQRRSSAQTTAKKKQKLNTRSCIEDHFLFQPLSTLSAIPIPTLSRHKPTLPSLSLSIHHAPLRRSSPLSSSPLFPRCLDHRHQILQGSLWRSICQVTTDPLQGHC